MLKDKYKDTEKKISEYIKVASLMAINKFVQEMYYQTDMSSSEIIFNYLDTELKVILEQQILYLAKYRELFEFLQGLAIFMLGDTDKDIKYDFPLVMKLAHASCNAYNVTVIKEVFIESFLAGTKEFHTEEQPLHFVIVKSLQLILDNDERKDMILNQIK